MNESCDVVVIGGGPGGSATATYLADAGLSVILLDRAHFPREHVGESLLPASLPILEELGVMPAVKAAGFIAKSGATMVWGSDTEPWSWYFSGNDPGAVTSFQVVRSQFDALLLENAREHGVDVREGHQVLDVEFDNERATGVLFRAAGDEGRLAARFVVDASGQAALISRKLGLQQWDTFFKNLAVYSYYRDARRLDPPNDGNIFIESYVDGWLWMIPLHTGVVSVGAVVDREIGHEGLRGQSADDFLAAQIEQAPHLRARLAKATRTEPATVVRDWSYTSSTTAGDGWVLVGDAACFVDPLFSSGVHLALQASRLAASYVRAALKDAAVRESAAESYRSIYERQYRYFHATAELFYATNRSAEGYFWEARRILGDEGMTPREAFVSIVAGQPAQGYERVVIERGEIPKDIAREIRRVEGLSAARAAAAEAFEGPDGGERLLAWIPKLSAHARMDHQASVQGGNDGNSYRIVSRDPDSLVGGLELSVGTANGIELMDGRRSVAEIIRGIQSGAEIIPGFQQHGSTRLATAIDASFRKDIVLLYRSALLDLTPRHTGRNDICPCGSGKKYKRCHGRGRLRRQ